MRNLKLQALLLAVMLGSGISAGLMPAGEREQTSQAQSVTANQRPGPPGTIRVRVRLIPVDVIVTDDHDRPVTDLKQEDFQVFENGRPQEIQHFALQTFTPSPVAAAPGAPPPGIRISGIVEPTPQSARTFLILLGRGRHQQALKAVDALIRFVRENLLPQDRVAVYAYNRASDFTTDREQIVEILEQYKKVSDKIESWLELNLRGFSAVYGARQLPKSLQPDVAGIFEGSVTLASRRVPPGRTTAEGKIVQDWNLAAGIILGNADRAAESGLRLAAAEGATAAAQTAPTAQAMLAADQIDADAITLNLPFDEFIPRAADSLEDMQNIFTCIEYMRYLEGEKHLLFFSGRGLLFPHGNTDYDKGIAAVANDARVAIDTFHTGGLSGTIMPTRGVTLTATPKGSSTAVAPPPMTKSVFGWGDTAQAQSLRTISAITGGRAAIYQDIGKSLEVVDQTSRASYLLGYYPKDENWNGKYRQISVKVNRPGLKVYFRRGYYARDRLQPYDKAEFMAFSRISAAGGWADNIDDVPFKVSTTNTRDDAGQPQLKIDLRINAAKVTLQNSGGIYAGRLRVAVFYADGRQRMLGDLWTTVGLQLQEAAYREYLKSGIPCSIMIPAKSSSMYLTVVVYDVQGDRVGSRRVQVQKLFAP